MKIPLTLKPAVLLIGLVVVSLLLVVVLVYAFTQRWAAQHAIHEADVQHVVAEDARAMAEMERQRAVAVAVADSLHVALANCQAGQ